MENMKEIQDKIDKIANQIMKVGKDDWELRETLNRQINAWERKLSAASIITNHTRCDRDVDNAIVTRDINSEYQKSHGKYLSSLTKIDEVRLPLYTKDVNSAIEFREMLTKHSIAIEGFYERIATSLEKMSASTSTNV